MTEEREYRRRPPPHSPARAFLDEQEERHEQGQRDIVNGQAHGSERGYDRSGKLVLTIRDPAELQGKPVPTLDWMIEGWLLRRTVALVTGEGGTGKSILMQQLGTACAVRQDWVGIPVKPARVLAMFCEDDDTLFHIRQERINAYYGVDYQELSDGGFRWTCRPGEPNTLETFDRNTDRGTKTPLFHALREGARAHRADLVILDTAADVYGGNENYRTQVRNFIASLRGLAIEINGAVIITAHPSVAGIATGSGISGSTAWHNSVRARAFLTKPTSVSPEMEDQVSERILRFPKNNAGPASGPIALKWDRGAYVATGAAGASTGPLNEVGMIDLRVALKGRLREMVEQGSRAYSGHDFRDSFTNKMRRDGFQKYSQAQIISAVEGMIKRGDIVRVELGPPRQRRVFLRLPDQLYPDEKGQLPLTTADPHV